ncbi:MAG TPA: hypothetical protein VKZ18_00510, partial [Polyangia bacterium]|nr:hypothetical protein [Polyangia bacterium]
MSDPPINERLYALLPLFVRQRDAENGQPLRALLAIMETQFQRVEDDIAGLYDNWFIETCAPWVIPYIADLLAVPGLNTFPGGGSPTQAFNERAYVANTIAFRRRKGTAAVLERLAQDVTGWPAHVVEFFQRLITTQNVNHVRATSFATVSLHDDKALRRLGGPFETAQHTLDVRHVDDQRGKYNVPNIGVYLWRLPVFPAIDVPATPAEGGVNRFRFNPLGADMLLFNQQQTRADLDVRTTEDQVPTAIGRRLLFEDYEAIRQGQPPALPGFLNSITVKIGGNAIPPAQLAACDLSTFGEASVFEESPPSGQILAAIDPELGRLEIDPAQTGAITVSYFYGFGGEIGGGFYDPRAASPDAFADDPAVDPANIQPVLGGGNALEVAIGNWMTAGSPTPFVFEIGDSEVYQLSGLTLPAGDVEIRALQGDRDQQKSGAARPVRPLIEADGGYQTITFDIGQGATTPDAGSTLRLTGLLVSAGLVVSASGAAALAIRHCTLVPGVALDTDGSPKFPEIPGLVATLAADAPKGSSATVSLTRVITGRIALPTDVRLSTLTITDSIVDTIPNAFLAESPPSAPPDAIVAGAATIQGTTVFGDTKVGEMVLGSNSIFMGTIIADRVQQGCLRFSYFFDVDPLNGEVTASPPDVLPPSHVPQQFDCQPTLALAGVDPGDTVGQESVRLTVTPTFRSTSYGDPYYAQLDDDAPSAITKGASDGSEMGVFSFLQQPQRLSNLMTALADYLRFGLEAGPFFVTQTPPPVPPPVPPLPPSP